MRVYEKSLGKVSLTPEGYWENKAYNRLSLVKHPLTGKVYISKKDVPYNETNPIEVTNTEYWMFVCDSGGSINIDSEFSLTSTNPVQNKVITQMLFGIQNELIDILGE